jgi:hypothetical protein
MTASVRSTFVTVLGWAFVGLGALGAMFCSVMALVTLAGQRAADQAGPFGKPYRLMGQAVQAMPPPWPWLYAHQSQLLLVAAALMVLHLGVALGLLARRNAARIAFVVLMVLDIVLQALSVPYMQHMQTVSQQVMEMQMPAQMPPFFRAWMEHVMALQRIEAIFRPVALAAIFGWIAWRLCGDAARREFKANRATAEVSPGAP